MEESEIQETRTVIFGIIELISSLQEQIEYQETVPIANVPAELVCQWFDDHNPPSRPWFSECFSQHEQEVILEFHNFYESKLSELPDTYDVHELHKSPAWHSVVQKAKTTLQQIGTKHA